MNLTIKINQFIMMKYYPKNNRLLSTKKPKKNLQSHQLSHKQVMKKNKQMNNQ